MENLIFSSLNTSLEGKISVKVDTFSQVAAQTGTTPVKIGSITIKKGINRIMFGCEITPLKTGSHIHLSMNTSDEIAGGRAYKRMITCSRDLGHDISVERTFVADKDTTIYFYGKIENPQGVASYSTVYYPYYEVYHISQ